MFNRYYYSNLGTNCNSQTTAITSNEKFLPPLDSIYFHNYTKNFLIYPGHEEDNTLNKNLKPNLIDKLKDKLETKLENKKNKQCNTCRS